MKSLVAVLISTCVVCGAYAQAPAPASVPTAEATNHAIAASDSKREAMNEKHIAELHAKLKITADQEKLWSGLAKSMRESALEVDAAIDKRIAAIGTATAVDDLNAYAAVAQAHVDSVKKFATDFAPLYAAMSDDQKKTADAIFTHRDHDKKHGHSAMKKAAS
ncbi:MAG TPA: Spy/CpxP family protein refolding chaperone [Burkholderiaceae bacterium]|jgi:hypothetical protein